MDIKTFWLFSPLLDVHQIRFIKCMHTGSTSETANTLIGSLKKVEIHWYKL